MQIRDIARHLLTTVLAAVVLALLAYVWNWATDGRLIRAIQGLTLEDLQRELETNAQLKEQLKGPKGDPGLPGKPGAPDAAAGPSIPRGAVVAFDRSTGCPNGWIPFLQGQSRTIVGASFQDADLGPGLTRFKHDDTGGIETVILDGEQLPSHTHDFMDTYFSGTKSELLKHEPNSPTVSVTKSLGADRLDYDNHGWRLQSETFSKGESKEISVRAPYIALYFCTKQ